MNSISSNEMYFSEILEYIIIITIQNCSILFFFFNPLYDAIIIIILITTAH